MAKDNHVYGFGPEDAEHLLQNLGATTGPTGTPDEKPFAILCKNGGTPISGRSGSTVSSGTCTIYRNSSGSLTDAAQTIPVYNLSTTAIAANAYVVASWAGGCYVAIWEDC